MAEELTLEQEHEALLAKHEALQQAHKELQQKAAAHGLVEKKAYEYADDECRPVPMQAGAKCANCGWEFGGKEPKDKEPHPIA